MARRMALPVSLLLLLAGAALACGQSPSPTAAGLPLVAEPYRAEEQGYTIRYPEGWVCAYDDQWAPALGCFIPLPGVNRPRLDNLEDYRFVVIMAYSVDELSPAGVAASANAREVLLQLIGLANTDVWGSAPQFSEVQDTKAGSEPAAYVDVNTSHGYYGVPQSARIVITRWGDRVIMVNGYSAPAVWEDFLPTFSAMVASMTFFEP